MPKFGAHILFAELAQERRPEVFEPLHKNALRLGAVGPDVTLFLFDPANRDVVRGFDLAMTVLVKIGEIKDKLDQITKVLGQPVEDLGDWLTGGLLPDAKELVNTGLETLLSTLKLGGALAASGLNFNNPLFNMVGKDGTIIALDFIKELKNRGPMLFVDMSDNFGFPFRHFGHPYTDDAPWTTRADVGDYSKWWWMDMLHYRKTGTFGATLLEQARGSLQKSYAKGYMTHIGGDICGHPFINSLVGGPFRNHAYRHIVLESLADTWLWKQQGRGDILSARFDRSVKLDEHEIESVAQLILGSMRTVYQDPMLPKHIPGGYPTVDDLVGAYNKMSLYLKLSTSDGIRRPEPPPESLPELFKELQDLLARNLPGAPPALQGTALDYVIALLSWALRGLVLLAMLATLPAALLMRLAAASPRWLLYFVHLALFMLLSGIRTLLAFMGYGYAGADDFDSFGFLEDFVTSEGDLVEQGYPRASTARPKLPFYWLIPPRKHAVVEDPRTAAGPIPHGAMPSWMIDPANKMDPSAGMMDAFMTAVDPDATIRLENTALESASPVFGNAVDFSLGLLDGSIPIPDFDLDGDRGFGFRPWEGHPQGATRYL